MTAYLATGKHLTKKYLGKTTDLTLARLEQVAGVLDADQIASKPPGQETPPLLPPESGAPVAWLSLEPEDNDPTRFLSYVIAALQTLDAQIGTTALAMLRTPQPPPPETVLAVLTNDLVEGGGGDVALVLDDYHVITAEPIQRGMTFLLEHLPPQLHLVLATRADPLLPLARLRAQGQLTEVRATELRFGATETSVFLLAVMGLDLPPEAIATLERRTEGWIAGLQLAALSLQGRADVSGFLAAFQGQLSTVLGWMNTLPEALVCTRPLLCVYHARLLTFTNQLEAAEARLEEAEEGVQEEVPASQAPIIMGWVLDTRGGIFLFSGDIPRAVSLAHRALELLPESEVVPRASALATTTRAYLVSGDVTPASEHAVVAAVALIRTSDNPFAAVSSICLLARLHILQGQLRQAAATYARVVQVVPRPEVLQTTLSSLFYYFGQGDLLRECNELEAAERHLVQGMALVKETLTLEPFVAVRG